MSSGFILPSEHVARHHFRDPAFKRVFILSLTIHLVLLAVAGTATLFRMSGTSYAPSYTVDLVTLPPSPAAKPARVKAVKPAASGAAKVERKPAARVMQEKVVEDSPIVAEPVKTRVGDEAASRERKKRLEDLEKQVASMYESYRNEEGFSVDELPQAVVSTEQNDSESSDGVRDAGVAGPSADIRFRAYYDTIWSLIRADWVLPKGVAGSEDNLLTVVGIRISTTGVIEDHWIEKGSGNIYYDQSVLRAITKASPLPPLPQGLDKEPLEVGINFTP